MKSSETSVRKPEMDFMMRSTVDSTPVRSSVVIASVATLRFGSLISASSALQHGATAYTRRRAAKGE